MRVTKRVEKMYVTEISEDAQSLLFGGEVRRKLQTPSNPEPPTAANTPPTITRKYEGNCGKLRAALFPPPLLPAPNKFSSSKCIQYTFTVYIQVFSSSRCTHELTNLEKGSRQANYHAIIIMLAGDYAYMHALSISSVFQPKHGLGDGGLEPNTPPYTRSKRVSPGSVFYVPSRSLISPRLTTHALKCRSQLGEYGQLAGSP